MKLATVRVPDGRTTAVRVETDRLVDLGVSDVGALLARDDWRAIAEADGPTIEVTDEDFVPVVPKPGKIVCVGLNYLDHITELGMEVPKYPTLFTKFAESLIGARDNIAMPPESAAIDWEAELVVVVGKSIRRANPEDASAAIAGFTVMNDVSARDWQSRTDEWLQGKTFESTSPLGPVMVTPDELPGGVRPTLAIRTEVSGEKMQESNTSELAFDPVTLVQYISTIVTLNPGDLIATGTPGGVGAGQNPPRYLAENEVVVTEIEGIGRLENLALRG